MLDLKGTFVPLLTPFTDDMSAVSEVRLARHVRKLVLDGAPGFVVGPDCGEFGTLGLAERRMVVEIVLRESQGQVPLIVNATCSGTMAALDLATHASRHGARAVLLSPPFIGRYTIEEIQLHIRTVAKFCDIPVLLVTQPDIHPNEMFEEVLRNTGIRLVEPLKARWPEGMCSAPYSTTDEFVIDACVCSPLGLLDSGIFANSDPTPELEMLARNLRKHGVARYVKSIWDFELFEIGPPRAPMQRIERQYL